MLARGAGKPVRSRSKWRATGLICKSELLDHRDRHKAIIVTTTSVMEIRAVQSGIDDTYVGFPKMVPIALERLSRRSGTLPLGWKRERPQSAMP